MQKQPILVTGTLAFDHLFTYGSTFLEQLQHATEKQVLSVSFQPERYVKKLGGTGANIAWNVALLGATPLLAGNVGADGAEYLGMLKERGIDTRGVQTFAESMTATGVCCTDNRAHQIWFFYKGADILGHWPEKELEGTAPAYAVIGPRNPVHMQEGIAWCNKRTVPCLFDPGQHISDFSEAALRDCTRKCTGVILNAFEWEVLRKRLGCTPADITAHAQYLIVTQGEDGHMLYTNEGEEHFGRCDCDAVINPTGAGDGFRAGLVLALTHGWSLREASQLGATVASFIVEQEGALLQTLDKRKLDERLRKTYGNAMPQLP